MRVTPRPKRSGFTLIELSIAMAMGVAICSMVIALFNQQIAFLKIFRAQNFLTEEAPIISMYVSRLVGKAERFRLHASLADALSGANPRLTASPVMVLNFRQPDGTVKATILAFQNLGSGNALYYYVVPASGVLGTPQWTLSKKPTAVSFFVNTTDGVLRMQLSGINGERITYSGCTM